MEYQILEAADAETLVVKVNAAIADGWKPIGGLAVAVLHRTWSNERKGYDEDETFWSYTQAMTKGGRE